MLSNPRISAPLARIVARLKNKARVKNRRPRRNRNGRSAFRFKRNGLAVKMNRGARRMKNRHRRARKNTRRSARRMNRRRNGGLAVRLNRRRNGRFGRKANRRGFGVKRNRRFGKRRNGLAIQANPRRRNYGRRRNSFHFRKRNGLAIHANRRRNGRFGRKRNSRIVRFRNPSIPGVSWVQGKIREVPVVGATIATALVPAALGAVSMVGLHLFLGYAVPFVPAAITDNVVVRTAGNTIGGVVLGGLIGLIGKKTGLISTSTAAALGTTIVAVGAGIDALKAYQGSDSLAGDFGDGGLWALGQVDYGAMDGDEAAILAGYSDAQPGDAQHVVDIDPDEAATAQAGPRAWRMRFPMVRRQFRVQQGFSQHAGVPGHRLGWLVRLIGFKGLMKLSMAPPDVRQQYIAQLRAEAVRLLPGDQIPQQAQPQMAGYGAILYAQG